MVKHLVWMIVILPVFVLSSELSLAVLDFEPRGINSDQAVIITDMLRTELLKTGKITIVEREKINAIMKEHQYSEVGVTESVELGKILGVDKIIFGRIGMLGDSYIITVRMIDVETAKVDFADQYSCQMTMDSISKVMKDISERVLKYLPPIEGKVALRDGNVVYITLTSKDGIREGMELPVFRIEKRLDKEGNVIFEDEKEIGEIRVLKISSKGSMAKVFEEKEEIKEGDTVKVVVKNQKVESKKSEVFQNPVASNEKILPYWIEHDENGKPMNYLWVKVPEIPAKSSKVIYIEKEAGYSPNGDKVFEFFDDFDGSELDRSKWSISGSSYSNFDSIIEISSIQTVIYSQNAFSPPFVAQSLSITKELGKQLGFNLMHNPSTRDTPRIYFLITGSEDWYIDNNGDGSYEFYADLFSEESGDVFETKIVLTSSKIVLEYSRNGVFFSRSDNYGITSDLKVVLGAWCIDLPYDSYGEKVDFDYVFIRKYADSEPIVTVQNKGTYYEVMITNPNSYDLTDFQVAIPISKLNITSATESLKIFEEGS